MRLACQYSPYTFTKYLQRRRILQAAYLLTETDTLIEQIVVEVGYENSSHFHKLFKEEYGMTPKNTVRNMILWRSDGDFLSHHFFYMIRVLYCDVIHCIAVLTSCRKSIHI